MDDALRRASEPPLDFPTAHTKRLLAAAGSSERRRKRPRALATFDRREPNVPEAARLPSADRSCVANEPSQLHEEVAAFAAAAAHTQPELDAQEAALALLRTAVAGLWSAAELHLFGSSSVSLALPGSDLDVVLLEVPGAEGLATSQSGSLAAAQRKTALLLLGTLRALLKATRGIRSSRLIAARVQIVKCVVLGVPVDLTIGLRNGIAAVPLVRALTERLPSLRPLVLVLKSFLAQRRLNTPFSGGLSSYMLTSLVAAWLMTQPPGPLNLGDALAEITRFYGCVFDYKRTTVSVAAGGFVPRSAPRTFTLALADPQEPSKDIGAGAFNLRDIRAFAAAGKLLQHHRSTETNPWAAVQADGHSRPEKREQLLGRLINVELALKRRPQGAKPL